MKKSVYFYLILIVAVGILLGVNLNNHFIVEAQAPWFGSQFWGQPYNWSGNTYNWGVFDYGYSGVLGGFPYGNHLSSTWSPQNSYTSSITSYNPFVPFSSPWALDPGFFPPGWGFEGPGYQGTYGQNPFRIVPQPEDIYSNPDITILTSPGGWEPLIVTGSYNPGTPIVQSVSPYPVGLEPGTSTIGAILGNSSVYEFPGDRTSSFYGW